MSFIIDLFFSDGDSERVDEVFSSRDDAIDYADECIASYGQGRDILELAGEEYDDADIIDYDIYEVDD